MRGKLFLKSRFKELKLLTLLLLMSIGFSSFTSKSIPEEENVLKAVVNYIKDWDSKLEKRYNNAYMLHEIENAKFNTRCAKDLSSYRKIKGFMIVTDSLIEINEYKFSYPEAIKKLKKFDNKRMSVSIDKKKYDKSKIRLTYPILSLDKKTAIVFVDYYSGPLAASTELYILEKKNNEWIIKDRILKSIS